MLLPAAAGVLVGFHRLQVEKCHVMSFHRGRSGGDGCCVTTPSGRGAASWGPPRGGGRNGRCAPGPVAVGARAAPRASRQPAVPVARSMESRIIWSPGEGELALVRHRRASPARRSAASSAARARRARWCGRGAGSSRRAREQAGLRVEAERGRGAGCRAGPARTRSSGAVRRGTRRAPCRRPTLPVARYGMVRQPSSTSSAPSSRSTQRRQVLAQRRGGRRPAAPGRRSRSYCRSRNRAGPLAPRSSPARGSGRARRRLGEPVGRGAARPRPPARAAPAHRWSGQRVEDEPEPGQAAVQVGGQAAATSRRRIRVDQVQGALAGGRAGPGRGPRRRARRRGRAACRSAAGRVRSSSQRSPSS